MVMAMAMEYGYEWSFLGYGVASKWARAFASLQRWIICLSVCLGRFFQSFGSFGYASIGIVMGWDGDVL